MSRRRPIDDFGELPALKRRAQAMAENNHHRLHDFHLRPNDDTKLSAYCERCGGMVVINLEPSGELPPLYGPVLRTLCKR